MEKALFARTGNSKRNTFWASVNNRAASTSLAKLLINLGAENDEEFSVGLTDIMVAKTLETHVAVVKANSKAYDCYSARVRNKVKNLKSQRVRAKYLSKLKSGSRLYKLRRVAKSPKN